jgi:hypothetical protein
MSNAVNSPYPIIEAGNFVKLHSKVNHNCFGCEEKYFDQYIKGKTLKVANSDKSPILVLEDENKEQWTAHASDVVALIKNRSKKS